MSNIIFIYNNSIFQFRSHTSRENLSLKHIPDLKCIPNLEHVLENKNALTILTVLFKQFPFRSVFLLIVTKFLRTRSERSFFRNDGIVLDRSVRSRDFLHFFSSKFPSNIYSILYEDNPFSKIYRCYVDNL